MNELIIVIAPVVGLLFFLWLSARTKAKAQKEEEANAKPPAIKIEKPTVEAVPVQIKPVRARPQFTRAIAEEEVEADDIPAMHENESEVEMLDDESFGKMGFRDLIERFTNPQKFKKHQQAKTLEKPIKDPEAATEKARQQLGSRIDPEAQKRERYERGMAEYWDDYKPFESDLLEAEKKVVEEMKRKLKHKKRPGKYSKLFKKKGVLTQAIIMKEILDKPPHF